MKNPHNKPLINWDLKTRVINTQYGNITYMSFCENECKRIPRTVVKCKDDKVCLMEKEMK